MPSDRASEFRPLAAAVSDSGTAAMIRAGIEAYAKATPVLMTRVNPSTPPGGAHQHLPQAVAAGNDRGSDQQGDLGNCSICGASRFIVYIANPIAMAARLVVSTCLWALVRRSTTGALVRT